MVKIWQIKFVKVDLAAEGRAYVRAQSPWESLPRWTEILSIVSTVATDMIRRSVITYPKTFCRYERNIRN